MTIVAVDGNMSFSPNPATMRAGRRVAWRNATGATHDINQDGGAFRTGNIAPGGTSVAITVSSQGSFGYHCIIHPSMVGTLDVTP